MATRFGALEREAIDADRRGVGHDPFRGRSPAPTRAEPSSAGAPGRRLRTALVALSCAALSLLGAACSAGDESSETLAQVDRPELITARGEADRARDVNGAPAASAASDPMLASDAAGAPDVEEDIAAAVRDRGIGIVYFDQMPGSDNGGGADTMLVLRDTVRQQILARYILRRDSTSWWYVLDSRAPIESNSLEFDYEVEGLPVAGASPDARWVHVVHGIASDGTPRSGWVKVTPGRHKFRRWPAVLRERALFFADGVAPQFHGSPRGTPVEFAIAGDPADPERADYIMHPLQVQGDWMKVRVTSPSDMCASPGAVRQMVLWVRYLDDDGRPRVWYHTRGC